MPSLIIPLKDSQFQVKVQFSKVGDNKTAPIIRDAIIDTGAMKTCISYSVVTALGIPPDSPHGPAGTASGEAFCQSFPIRVVINQQIFKVMSCSVLFEPTRFLKIMDHHAPLIDNPTLHALSKQQGVPTPDIVFSRAAAKPNGKFDVDVYSPGAGQEQATILIGMDLLSQFDWAFSKASRELVIAC